MKAFFEEDKKFIVTFRSVYQIYYSKNAGFSSKRIYYQVKGLPLTKKGRFYIQQADFVNSLVERDLVVD